MKIPTASDLAHLADAVAVASMEAANCEDSVALWGFDGDKVADEYLDAFEVVATYVNEMKSLDDWCVEWPPYDEFDLTKRSISSRWVVRPWPKVMRRQLRKRWTS